MPVVSRQTPAHIGLLTALSVAASYKGSSVSDWVCAGRAGDVIDKTTWTLHIQRSTTNSAPAAASLCNDDLAMMSCHHRLTTLAAAAAAIMTDSVGARRTKHVATTIADGCMILSVCVRRRDNCVSE